MSVRALGPTQRIIRILAFPHLGLLAWGAISFHNDLAAFFLLTETYWKLTTAFLVMYAVNVYTATYLLDRFFQFRFVGQKLRLHRTAKGEEIAQGARELR